MAEPIKRDGFMVARLPFEGFYNSRYSSEMDHIIEQDGEHYVERQKEDGIALHRHLEAQDFQEALNDATNHRAFETSIAKCYVDAFSQLFFDETEVDLQLEFESMTSPREYNFETDKIYAYVPIKAIEQLIGMSAESCHKRLEKAIKATFTSRSGFASHYSNKLADWLAKPLADWDYNEIGTLIGAYMPEDFDWDVYYRVCDDGLWQEFESAVNWPRFQEAIRVLIEAKDSEWSEANPGKTLPQDRCTETSELPLTQK